jgi:hypothetical protein
MASQRPRVHRKVGETRLWVWMPYSTTNRQWLKDTLGARIKLEWVKRPGESHWEIARNHLRAVVEALADRFGSVDVYLEYKLTERCDTRCRDARSDDCECSCLGANHGGAAYMREWRRVGETTLVASGDRKLVHLRVERRPRSR